MSQQFSGPIASHAGTTETVTISVSAPYMKSNAMAWFAGAFGVSVTQSVVGATFGVAVWSNIAGVSIKMAEITDLRGLSSVILPMVNESPTHVLGSSQITMLGILAPRTVVLTGVSAGVGLSFGCVVTAALYRP